MDDQLDRRKRICLLTYAKCIRVYLVLKEVFLAEKRDEGGGVAFQVTEMCIFCTEMRGIVSC